MKDTYGKWLLKLELTGLYTLAFAMPTLESIKWMGMFLFLVGVVGRKVVENRFSWRRPTGFEIVLLAMGMSAVVSTLVNWPLPNGFSGLERVTSVLLVGWLIYISAYNEKQLKGLLLAIVAGVMVGLVVSGYLLFSGQNPHLEFVSIPNLNRSVIYHVLCLFVMLAIVMDSRRLFSNRLRVIMGICFIIGVGCLFIMASRGALLGFVGGMILLAVFVKQSRKIWLIQSTSILGTIILISVINMTWDNHIFQSKIRKFTRYYYVLKEGSDLSGAIGISERVRYDYIRVSWAQITQKGKMFLGSGPGTFKYIDVESLSLEKPLLRYKKKPGWEKPSHAHNEFLTLWVEVGLVGLFCHVLFLCYFGSTLWQHRKRGQRTWQLVAGVGFFATATISGLFNTVLTNEMGWLAMMIVGAAMHEDCKLKEGKI